MMLLLFDIDGTLTKDNKVSTKAFRRSVNDLFGVLEYSENWNEYKYDSDVGIIDTILWNAFSRHVEKQELEVFQDYYLMCFEKLLMDPNNILSSVSGVSSFFETIKCRDDVAIALFTGGFPKVAKKKLNIISVDDSLLRAAAFDGFSRVQIFEECLLREKNGNHNKIDSIVLFGDSISDIEISKKYKIPLIGVTTHLTKTEYYEYGVKKTINDYLDISIKDLMSYGNC